MSSPLNGTKGPYRIAAILRNFADPIFAKTGVTSWNVVDKVVALIPGASGYLDKAKSLGAVAGPLVNGAGLIGALGKLEIDAATAAKFIPTVTKFLGKASGSKLGGLLTSALK